MFIKTMQGDMILFHNNLPFYCCIHWAKLFVGMQCVMGQLWGTKVWSIWNQLGIMQILGLMGRSVIFKPSAIFWIKRHNQAQSIIKLWSLMTFIITLSTTYLDRFNTIDNICFQVFVDMCGVHNFFLCQMFVTWRNWD
jgi:hypothetical protein